MGHSNMKQFFKWIKSNISAVFMIALLIGVMYSVIAGYFKFKDAEQRCAESHGIFFAPHGYSNICIRQDQVITKIEVNQ